MSKFKVQHKFKVGDKVSRTYGCPFSNGEVVATVEDVEGGKLWLQETGKFIDDFEVYKVEDTSKYHKHHDLIIQWAKGARIELKTMLQGWLELECPCWDSDVEYRIKPTTPKTDKERIAELEDRVQELENR